MGVVGWCLFDKAESFIIAIRKMEQDMKIPAELPEIKDEDIEELAAYADKEANPLYPVPMLMDRDELKIFYRMVESKSQRKSEIA